MNRLIVAGNWKMHGSRAMADSYADGLRQVAGQAQCRVWLFPPTLYLERMVAAVAGSSVEIGVQNIHAEATGAFTGETSAEMVRDGGARFALIGHSERRALFGETDVQVAGKTRAALASGLTPLVCVGERLDERQAGNAEAVVVRQMAAVIDTLSPADVERIVVAYEPVWAIGTGETATPETAQAMHAVVRYELSKVLGKSGSTPILYGGSVKPDNAAELFAQDDIDGALVGGASLDVKDFGGIIAAADAVASD